MRSKAIKSLTLAVLLCGAGTSEAQQQGYPQGGARPEVPGSPGALRPPKQKTPPEKSKLEELLAEALRNNPDIRVAAAKLAEAEAKLNRARVQVTQQVVTLYQSIVSQRALVEVAQKKYDRMTELHKQGAVDIRMLDEASANLTVAKAKLAELEAQLPGLLGRVQKSNEARAATAQEPRILYDLDIDGDWEIHLKVDPKYLGLLQAKANIPQGDRIRKALQTPIKVDYKDMTFDAILKDLSKKVEGLSFRIRYNSNRKINLWLEESLPVSTILQALSDETRFLFFVREYGILVTEKEDVPPGAMTVEEFLRQKPTDESSRHPGSGKNAPPQAVEGKVVAVDDKGFMTINIGSDSGLVKGHTLELFRLDPALPSPKYLGTIRLFEVRARQSAAQVVGRSIDTPEVGDRVSSRISGK